MEKITIAVIGIGRIGKMHLENIRRYFPQVTIKVVIDKILDDEWAKRSPISSFSSDPQDAFNDNDIQAVVIATPTATHAELIKQAAIAGKHVFCEKPVALNSGDIKEVISEVEKQGIKLQIGYNRRFDPQFQEVKNRVAAGYIGNPQIIKITNRDPVRPNLAFIPTSGGLFLDFSVHDFDMARFVTGSEISEVFAAGDVLIDPEIGRLGDIDTAVITLRLANKALCVIDNSRETNYGYDQRLEAFGSEGSVHAENTKALYTSLITRDEILTPHYHYSFVERYQESYINQFQDFFKSITSDQETMVGGGDAFKAVVVAEAARRSLKENRPVKVIY